MTIKQQEKLLEALEDFVGTEEFLRRLIKRRETMTTEQQDKLAEIVGNTVEPSTYLQKKGDKEFAKELGSKRLAELIRAAGIELTPAQLEQLKSQLDEKK